jgi:hypothetical protein
MQVLPFIEFVPLMRLIVSDSAIAPKTAHSNNQPAIARRRHPGAPQSIGS